MPPWTIAILAFLLGALVAAILLRRGPRPSGLLVMEEMFARKLRLAEKDRDQAVSTLAANQREMTGFEERFAALDQRIAGLELELETAQAALENAHDEARLQESVRVELEARVNQLGQVEARARAEGAKLREEHARLVAVAREEGDELRRDLAARRAELQALGARLDELEPLPKRLATLGAELDERERAHRAQVLELERSSTQRSEAALAEKEAERAEEQRRSEERLARLHELEREQARLAELASELPARSAELEQRSGELAAARDEVAGLRRELAERRAELQTAGARLTELELLPKRLAALGAELDERERAHRTQALELERAWTQRSETALAEKEAERAEEERLSEERLARVQELERELARGREHARELQGSGEEHALEAGELRREAERLADELATARAALARGETALGERAGRIAELEGTVLGKDVQIRELTRLPRELELAQGRGLELEQSLAQVQRRSTELEGTLRARERELQDLRRDLARQEKELRSAEAAREKSATLLAERVAKAREAEGELRAKNALVRQLEGELRTRAVANGTLRPVPRRNDERDDLQRIPGIGPVLEKKLNRLGFRTYRQIAALAKNEVETLAGKLGTTSERIRREGWLTAARSAMKSDET